MHAMLCILFVEDCSYCFQQMFVYHSYGVLCVDHSVTVHISWLHCRCESNVFCDCDIL